MSLLVRSECSRTRAVNVHAAKTFVLVTISLLFSGPLLLPCLATRVRLLDFSGPTTLPGSPALNHCLLATFATRLPATNRVYLTRYAAHLSAACATSSTWITARPFSGRIVLGSHPSEVSPHLCHLFLSERVFLLAVHLLAKTRLRGFEHQMDAFTRTRGISRRRRGRSSLGRFPPPRFGLSATRARFREPALHVLSRPSSAFADVFVRAPLMGLYRNLKLDISTWSFGLIDLARPGLRALFRVSETERSTRCSRVPLPGVLSASPSAWPL